MRCDLLPVHVKVATLITFNVSYRILDVADMLALIILTNIVIKCLTPASIISGILRKERR
jgi:hypothetical protein